MRKKLITLITGAIVAAALAGPATPAFAINDPSVPAGVCAADGSQAVGHPAADVLNGTPAGPVPNPGGSHFGLENHDRVAHCN